MNTLGKTIRYNDMGNLFGTSDMAAGYATSRPPVHREILKRVKPYLTVPCRHALDIGCGAGLSTGALHDLADRIVGLEPVVPMVQWARRVAPSARFVVGVAEALPFSDGSTDLIAAAGSLNYVDVELFFREATRTLTAGGVLVVYDFGPGRNFSHRTTLDRWFTAFEQRYPPPEGEAVSLSPSILRGLDSGFRVLAEESFMVTLPLSRRAFIDYVLTETSVSAAVRSGVATTDVRSWCEETLPSAWHGSSETEREILFPSYFVCMTPIR